MIEIQAWFIGNKPIIQDMFDFAITANVIT